MKKLLMLLAIPMVIAIAGCSRNIPNGSIDAPVNTGNNAQIDTGEDIPMNTIGITNETGTMQYSGELIIAGVGPIESFESTVAMDTLVLKRTFDDYSDHVFFPRQTWSNYLDIQEDMIPGNHVNFVGTVKALDAAAGNHYYEVVSVDELKTIGVPSKSEVETLIQRYAYCEQDSDCIGVYGKCPLGCHIAINAKFQTTVEKIINNFRDHQESQCMYKCMEIGKVTCNTNHICEATK